MGLGLMMGILGLSLPTPAAIDANSVLQLNYPLFLFLVALGAGYWIYRRQGIRSGGYAIAPVLAIVLLKPFVAVYFLVGCWLVYWLTQEYCRRTLTVGLNRYVVVLYLSTLYLWGTELLLRGLDPSLPVLQGSYLLDIAMLSYVNDAILYRGQGVLRSMVWVTGISMAGIWATNMLSFLMA